MRTTTVGESYTFTPAFVQYANQDNTRKIFLDTLPEVTGRIVSINERHNFFRVEYRTPNMGLLHECFPIPQAPQPTPKTEGFHSRPSKTKYVGYYEAFPEHY